MLGFPAQLGCANNREGKWVTGVWPPPPLLWQAQRLQRLSFTATLPPRWGQGQWGCEAAGQRGLCGQAAWPHARPLIGSLVWEGHCSPTSPPPVPFPSVPRVEVGQWQEKDLQRIPREAVLLLLPIFHLDLGLSPGGSSEEAPRARSTGQRVAARSALGSCRAGPDPIPLSPSAEANVLSPWQCRQEAYGRDQTHCPLFLLAPAKFQIPSPRGRRESRAGTQGC